MELREERFLFQLPYDARLGPYFANHGKDVVDLPREGDWQAFDLQAWLGLDSPPVEGTMRSTTLKFSSASRHYDPMYFVERSFPSFFEVSRAMIHPRRRWLYSRPIRWLRGKASRSGPSERLTVVEAVRIDEKPEESTQDWRFGQMKIALDRLNTFLLAAASVHGDPELAPVAPQDLPPLVFGMGWDLPRDSDEIPKIDLWTYLIHERFPGRPRLPLTRAEADLVMWMTVEHEHPLVRPSHLFLSAQQALHRGQLTQAIVDSGTAVEMLVSAAIRLVGPEKGYSAAKVQSVLEAPFASRVKDHFARLLEYSSTPAQAEDALGEWWQDGYLVRNAVVHEGRRATEDEASAAIGSAMQLQHDFTERLRTEGLGGKLPGVPQNVKEAADAARKSAGTLDL
jgi:hypothetical protein